MRQEVVLAMLAKEPSHGYELRARLDRALGPLAEGINEGQIYVTLAGAARACAAAWARDRVAGITIRRRGARG